MAREGPVPVPLGSDDSLPMLRPHEAGVRYAELGPHEIDLAGQTDRGLVRPRNEDAFVIAELERWIRIRQASVAAGPDAGPAGGAQGLVLAVADGIGGHGGGDVASCVALDALLQYAAYLMPWFSSVGNERSRTMFDDLPAALDLCQQRLWAVAERKGITSMAPGTTLTAAYVAWPAMYVVHAGDSRCYVLRHGILTQTTHDDTVAAQMVERHAMDAEAAEHSPLSNVLSNAVGGSDRGVTTEVRRGDLQRGDAVLLCTDGLTHLVPDADIAAIAGRAATAQAACGELIDAANRAGGNDNTTVVLARF